MTEKEQSKKHLISIKDDLIRKQWDEGSGAWQFSVVDVIAIATKSSDARNYWKVLKNRLKKADSRLVTKCNQLKMLASDGKWYMTDTADALTMLQIIEAAAPNTVETFRLWFEKMAMQDPSQEPSKQQNDGEAELTIDLYETPTDLVIHSMIPGVSLEELFISVGYKSVTIRGSRIMPKSAHPLGYAFKEIYWGPFSRTIALPAFIEVEGARASEHHGLLIITLPKINTDKTRILKL